MKKLFLLPITIFFFIVNLYSQNLDSTCEILISKMTILEKIDQINREDFYTTKNNSKLGIPGFNMSDGPHGYGAKPATSFPQSISVVSSWDPTLWYEFGKAMGQEFLYNNSNVQLGPCLDLSRDPRNGRTSESIGEDPYLGSIYGENLVKGIQYSPVISTIKHFIGTNKENNRTTANILLNNKNLENINGVPFKRAIQEGGSFGLMSSYNLINNIYSSENKFLLDTILRKRWGYPYFIMSDWGSIKNAKNSILAGNDLCMGSNAYKNEIENLIESNQINEKDINFLIKNVLKTKLLSGINEIFIDSFDVLKNQQLALKLAQKSIVLLKNEESILPLTKNKKIAIIGPSAKKIQLDGFGSSKVIPPYSISPFDGIVQKIDQKQILYSYGCPIREFDTTNFNEAREVAKKSDIVLFFGGLDETMEGEGYSIGGDRKNGRVELPTQQLLLIDEIEKVNPNIIVILQSGGVCSLGKYDNKAKGLLYAFYPGMEGGNAIADILFGDINPSGKLPVTIPENTEQLPEWNDDFNDDFGCGYRYFNKLNLTPAYPFGFGLNYSKINMEEVIIKSKKLSIKDTIELAVSLSNISGPIAEEVIQIYSYHSSENINEKKLLGFKKISIDKNSSVSANIKIPISNFLTYVNEKEKIKIKNGKYYLMVGNSSANVAYTDSIEITDINQANLEILNLVSYPKYPKNGDLVEYFFTLKNIGNSTIYSSDEFKIQFIDSEKNNINKDYVFTENFEPGSMIFIPINSDKMIQYFSSGIKSISLTVTNNEFQFSKNFKKEIQKKPIDLAIGKNIESNQSNTNISFLNDGNQKTIWQSTQSDYAWFTFDLENCFDIKEVQVDWNENYATKLYLLAGFSGNYLKDTIYKNKDLKFGKLKIQTSKNARFLKFVLYGRPENFENYAISNISIYGDTIVSCFELSKEQFYTFPNPTYDYIYFSQNLEKDCLITINDLIGKTVYQKNNSSESINLDFLNDGVYTITIENSEKLLFSNKFIKISKK